MTPSDLGISCEQDTLHLEQDSAANIHDIREYVEAAVRRSGIQAYIAAQRIDEEVFVDHLVEKSQGNFIYLRYVLPEIEGGTLKDLTLDALPVGLRNYYEGHWRRIKGLDEQSWLDYKLPVVMALTVLREPVSIDLIAEFSGIQDRRRVLAVLQDWVQFLFEETVSNGESQEKRYRVYHESFRDFISEKDEVREQGVSLGSAHQKIADKLWADFFGSQAEG